MESANTASDYSRKGKGMTWGELTKGTEYGEASLTIWWLQSQTPELASLGLYLDAVTR